MLFVMFMTFSKLFSDSCHLLRRSSNFEAAIQNSPEYDPVCSLGLCSKIWTHILHSHVCIYSNSFPSSYDTLPFLLPPLWNDYYFAWKLFKTTRAWATPQTNQKSLSEDKAQGLLGLGVLQVILISIQGWKPPAETRRLEFWKSARKPFLGPLFLKQQLVPGTDNHNWTLAWTHGRGK